MELLLAVAFIAVICVLGTLTDTPEKKKVREDREKWKRHVNSSHFAGHREVGRELPAKTRTSPGSDSGARQGR
jgi:hypothetical protein